MRLGEPAPGKRQQTAKRRSLEQHHYSSSPRYAAAGIDIRIAMLWPDQQGASAYVAKTDVTRRSRIRFKPNMDGTPNGRAKEIPTRTYQAEAECRLAGGRSVCFGIQIYAANEHLKPFRASR